MSDRHAVTAFRNPSDAAIRDLLARTRTIAVVGLSPKPSRPSHEVASYMQRFGYRIIPVRPGIESILGEPVFRNLAAVPYPVDLVDVFRAPEHVAGIVDAAIARRDAPALWFQDGVVNEGQAQRARAAGLTVVMDRCVYREYIRFFGATQRPAPDE